MAERARLRASLAGLRGAIASITAVLGPRPGGEAGAAGEQGADDDGDDDDDGNEEVCD